MLEGHNSRVDAIRGDVKALFNLKRWDKDDHGHSDHVDGVGSLRKSAYY